ncbi:MAG TPA: hypothetical protein VIU11_25475 [Nakamurella sp.]
MAERRGRLPIRIAPLAAGGLALLLRLDAGLPLLGLPAPLRWSRLADMHGVLKVLGSWAPWWPWNERWRCGGPWG